MPLPPALTQALDARIAPVQKPAGYRLAAAGVALGMVLLPLLYVALVAGVAALVLVYAVVGLGIFSAGRVNTGTILLYVGPLVIGGLVVVALVKPLFAPRRVRSEPVSLAPESEPVLFAFVAALARAVGAPAPSRIDVDCCANASAGFRRGVLSMAGSDLVLTVGLPLAGALSVRQLAGVLAHEFGHFAQGGGMRLTYLTEHVSGWFERVVYERDVFDEWLERTAADAGGWTGLVLGLAIFGVSAGRFVLRALMTVGRRLSRTLLRQMEFDADRYEVRVAGAPAFAETSRALVLLSAAEQVAYSDLNVRLRERRIPDDLPAFVDAARLDLPDETAHAVVSDVLAARTGPLDTHPAVADRIARADADGSTGLDLPDTPARGLFADFDALARRATDAFYAQILDGDEAPMTVVQTAETLADRKAEGAAFAALLRATRGVVTLPPVADLLRAPSGPDAEPDASALAAARADVLARAPAADAAIDRWGEAQDHLGRAEQASALATAGASFDPAEFGVTAGAAAEHAEAARRDTDAAMQDLGPFRDALRARLGAALGVWDAADQTAALAAIEAEWAAEGATPLDLLVGAARAAVLIDLVVAGGKHASEAVVQQTMAEVDAVWRGLSGMRDRLRAVAYPFAHGVAGTTLGDYVVPALPDRTEVGRVLHAAETASSHLQEVRMRVWGGLALEIERADAAAGLDPLPDVPPPGANEAPPPDEAPRDEAPRDEAPRASELP